MLFKELVESNNINRQKKLDKISDKLHMSTASHLNKEDAAKVAEYTDSSSDINRKLIKGVSLTPSQEIVHNTIKKKSKPLGHEVHLYSGTRTDFGKMARASKDGILVSPAHISTTHNFERAKGFAGVTPEPENIPVHMIHIHAKPEDKGLHVSRLDKNVHKGELETIIPSGTKLKYSHSTNHNFLIKHKNGSYNQKYQVHHFTIDSQD
jgi:hypothetical protein